MKFLLDMPMPQRTALWLRSQGHDAVHARDIGLAEARDVEILQYAEREKRIILTTDLDFPHLLSILPQEGPGILLIRLRQPTAQAIRQRLEPLLRTVPENDLAGAITVIEENLVRRHRLPIR